MVEWRNLCGYDYSEVQGKNVYIRNDSLRVFLRKGTNCSDKEYLLYDFSLNVGDTVVCGWRLDEQPYSPPDTTKFWVVQVDTINQNRVLTMEYYATFPDLWYVKSMTWTTEFGSDEHPFYPISTALDYCECSQQTMCLVDYGSALNNSCKCDTIVISVPQIQQLDFHIFPNPTDGMIFIQPIGVQVTLSDLTGKTVLQSILSDKREVDLSFLNSGVYLITIHYANGSMRREKIIKN